MIMKKFQAPTETEAILKAKEELGSQAVVLSVRTLKQRGIFKLFKKDMVEITAALEENEFAKGLNAQKALRNDKITQGSKVDYVVDDKTVVKSKTTEIEKKLDNLHDLIKNQIDKDSRNVESQKQQENKNTSAEDNNKEEVLADSNNDKKENSNYKFLQLIYKKMIDNEVDEKYADEIISEIESSLKKESNIDSILSAVYQKIILKLGEPKTIALSDKPKLVFFIGPTGVGKTTTLAKIASKFRLENNANVAFITADTYRIAAVEQLNTYASIIDCPVSVIYSPDEIADCITQYKDYDLILVDTAGRSHKESEQMDELKRLIENAYEKKNEFDIEIYLTVSITTKYKDLVNITQKYSDIANWSLVFTKLDETCALGNILNLKLNTNASLSYTSAGQNVPNDIEIINEQSLAKQLLGGKV